MAASCSGPECTRQSAAKALCTAHYQQQRRRGELRPIGTVSKGTGSKRGFAAMAPERQREIARSGGIKAHQLGTAHRWTPEEAKRAGREGGILSRVGRGKLAA